MNESRERRYRVAMTIAVVALTISVVSFFFAAFRSNAGYTVAVPLATEISRLKATVTAVMGVVKATPSQAGSAEADTETPTPPVLTPTPGATFTPWPAAPLCPDHGELHDVTQFHTLWNSAEGCHYEGEHGQDPFTAQVADAFPGMDLRALLGQVEVGHTNLSSPCENALGECGVSVGKHYGFKWSVNVPVAHPGAVGFEGNTVGLCNLVSQFHNFGDYSVEFETRVHTALVLGDQCMLSDLNDHGYFYVVQMMEYGQRVVPYQGTVLPYPDNPPGYNSISGPYDTADCDDRIAPVVAQCASTSAVSKWTSKPTGTGPRPPTSGLLQILFDIRDIYRVFDWNDQVHPFTWLWMCSPDAGLTYNPVGCAYNNSTSTLHEVAGTFPAAWASSGLFTVEVDANGRTRLTGEAFTTRYGTLDPFCTQPGLGTQPGTDCWPVKLVRAFVGKWGANLCVGKCSIITPANSPEHDIYFLNGQVVSETTPGAVPSGWIGPSN